MTTDKRCSEILRDIANDKKLEGNLTFQRILKILGKRSFGLALLLFALPSALPLSAIPGISFIFSLPILLFAIQMVVLRESLWLPQAVAKHTINHHTLCKIIFTSAPYLKKLEKLLKPRLLIMTSRVMLMINGAVLAFLSCLLMLGFQSVTL